jgi:hypothetical protein
MAAWQRSRPIRAVGTRLRRSRVERLRYEAREAEHNGSAEATEEASARRYVFALGNGICHIVLHHVSQSCTVMGGHMAPRIRGYTRFKTLLV